MERLFSRDDTKAIKGIAIILMLAHHLWSFPNRMAGGSLKCLFVIFGKSSITYFGEFGQICVAMFFFLGGYGTYLSFKDKPFDLVGKIKGLYISYWKVFFIFVPIAFLFFNNQPLYAESQYVCLKYINFSWGEALNNLIALETTYNDEWWFLRAYIYAVITFPLFKHIFDKFSLSTDIFIVVFATLLITNILPALGDLSFTGVLNDNYLFRTLFRPASATTCFWMGIVVAKYDLLRTLRESMQNHNLANPIFDVFIWFLIIYLRETTSYGSIFDIFYIPFLVVTATDIMNRLWIVKRVFLHLGRQSTNMWLIHTFFCYYFYDVVKIVVFTEWAIPSLLTLTVLTYLASFILDTLWKHMKIPYKKMCDYVFNKYGLRKSLD